jgi:hypothetical protein
LADLYFDHNVSHAVSFSLERAGHDLVTARDVSSERLPDDAQLLFTVQVRRVFVTHNRADFKMLHDAWLTWPAAFGMALPPHPGILVLDQDRPALLAEVLRDFLSETSPGQLDNSILWWHRRDGWRRPTGGTSWEPHQPADDASQE